MTPLRLLLCALVVVSCSQAERPTIVDAGPAPAVDTLTTIARSPWASALSGARPLSATANGWRFDGEISGDLPSRANAPIVLRAGGKTVRLTMLGGEAAGRSERSVIVYGDTVWSATRDAVEELRTIADPSARYEARYRITTDADEVRARDGRIEILAGGKLVLGTPAVEAAGSDGVRRALESTVMRDGDGWTLTIEGSLEGLAAPVVVDPLWTTVGSLAIARDPFSITTLSDGRVMVAGGNTGSGSTSTNTAEVFDPASNTWSMAGTAKFSDASALVELPSKKVLVMAAGLTTPESPQLWDPISKTFADIPGAPTFTDGRAIRVGSTVVLLHSAGTYKFTEPSTFVVGAAMPNNRRNFGMSALADGRVLTVGGQSLVNGKVVDTTEIYDPVANTWVTTTPMPVRRLAPGVITLTSGKVLITGGGSQAFCCQTSSQIFDPVAATWTTGPSLFGGTDYPSIASIGTRFYISGIDNDIDAIYDPPSNTMLRVTPPSVMRGTSDVAALSGGRVIKAGGWSGVNTTALTTIFNPTAKGGTCTVGIDGDCATGVCVDGICCDRACTGVCESCTAATSGTCTPTTGAPRVYDACTPYASCTSGACATGCATNGDCMSGNYCKAGKCVAKTANGAKCAGAGECASGNCVDGVCCTSTCSGQCEACDVSGDGTCVPIAGAPRGTRPACTAGDPQCGFVCDGVHTTACGYLPAGAAPCGSNACSGGIETHASTCNGAGACSDTPKDCGAYGCGATSCKSACSSKLDCKAGYVCVASACVPAPGLGSACTDPAACSTGFCVDGVCCGTASCGAGSTCAATGHEGTCFKKNGVGCSADGECAGNHCVDGVCCESACDGICEACSVPGQLGKCTAVRGAPRGKRPACPTGGAACEAHVCDGTDGKSCAAFVGADVVCHPATCKDGSAQSATSCDGKGACPMSESSACGAFRCDAKGERCLLACSVDADCIDGYGCVGGVCISQAHACSDDGQSAKRTDGVLVPCSPFLCKGGACATTCATTDDCAPGFVCDGSACAAPQSSDAGSGGCTTAAPGARGLSWTSLLLVVGMIAMRRRGLYAFALAALGCRSETAPQNVADAGSPAIVEKHDLDDEIAQLGVHADRTDFVEGGSAYTLSRAHLDVELPKRASGRVRLRRPESPDQWISIALDGGDVEGSKSAGRVTYRSTATDLALVAVEDGLEDVRVLHADDAPSSFTYRIEHGAGIERLAMRGRRVVALAADGSVRFSMQPPFAVDARGVRRNLTVSLDGWSVRLSLDTQGLAHPIVVDPLWTVSPVTKWNYRERPLLGVLPGGDLVIAGDRYQSERLSSATKTWTELPDLTQFSGNWAELSPGKFLMYGGLRNEGMGWVDTLKASIWTPGSDAVDTGSANFLHSNAPSVLIAAGVLVAGGSNAAGGPLSTSELYVPATGTWTACSPLLVARSAFGMAKLPGGKALVAGGTNTPTSPTPILQSAEVFDPATKKWTATGSLKAARYEPIAVALSTGKVLLAGGGQTTAELYDPTTGTWSDAGTTISTHRSGAGGLLAGDRVVVFGGFGMAGGESIAEIWDPTTKVWTRASDAPTDRYSETAVTYSNKVSFAGGNSFTDGYPDTVYTFSPLANGETCGRDGDCQSLHCADGICCNSACNGPCQSCGLSASKGTCSGVSGTPTHGSCAPYLTCSAGACATSCATNADCDATAFCGAGKCVAKKANGATCSAANECTSSSCVDGVCCNTACDGQCESCNETASKGTCVAVSGAPRGGRTACSGGTGECAARCDGVKRGACTFPPSVTSCGADACTAGVETHKRTCDGVGHCNDVPKTCGAFACGSPTCKSTCASLADCAAGFVCSGSTCIPAPGLGETCSTSKPCTGALSCTDGYCCGVASCGAGKSCGLPTTRGTCAKIDGETCAADGECGSGTCVDGVCCESRCDGQCQACDVPGKVGQCVPVAGVPHGKRPACSAGSNACEASSCDGSDGSACVALAGADVVCRMPSCEGGVFHGAAHCDGKGACAASVDTSCVPFACDSAGSACATSCTTAAECAPGTICQDGKCQGPKVKCSDDARAVVDGQGRSASCAPLLCRDGACLTSCKTSDDCAPGTLCDGSACVAPPAPSAEVGDSGGGCAIAPRGSSTFVAALAVLALLGRSRRRRA